ncbi:MAG: hypothetical protein HY671_14775 [Chloroflexi bacterium]|nr:hypothetical protein [Chloroflexota bacterium]
MPQLSVVNQPFGGRPNRVGDHIVDLLSRTVNRFDSVYLVAAFAKASGVSILFDALRNFVNLGGSVTAAIGVDQQGTSQQGLEVLLQAGAQVFIFHNPGAETFHPKYYLFERDAQEGVAIVGSNNLTRGGLYENFEFSVRIDHDLTVPSDAQLFDTFLRSFGMVTDVTTGMAISLSQNTLAELIKLGYLLDESRVPTGEEGGRLIVRPGPNPLFRRVSMPRGPRPTRQTAVPVQPPQPGQGIATFVMTLGARDTRQQTGYSRDIFIPLAARNANGSFWEWPAGYAPPPTGVSGNYLERRFDILVTPANGPTQLVRQVRFYAYAQRDEFRLNCGELVRGSNEGDILVVSKVQAGSGYDYDGAVISQAHPMYATFNALCTNIVPQSGKRWGYA